MDHSWAPMSMYLRTSSTASSSPTSVSKGFIGSQSTTKPSIKINVDEYVEGAKLFGVDNITLNNGVQDPSLLRQCLSYQLFDLAGLPSPRCNFAHVYVNGADMGIYVHVEPIKPAFLRQHFDEDDEFYTKAC